jgi:hypothetical protein
LPESPVYGTGKNTNSSVQRIPRKKSHNPVYNP